MKNTVLKKRRRIRKKNTHNNKVTKIIKKKYIYMKFALKNRVFFFEK